MWEKKRSRTGEVIEKRVKREKKIIVSEQTNRFG